jgi:clan AA aspartic protease (TIGR02281 family)
MNAWMDRRDPVLLEHALSSEATPEHITFMKEAHERRRRAGWLLWAGAAAALALLLGVILGFGMNHAASSAYQVGQVLSCFFWPALAVGVAKLLNPDRSQRSVVLVFLITCLVLAAFNAALVTHRRGGLQRLLNKESLTPEDHLAQVRRCAREGDFPCQEQGWRDYIATRPTDGKGPANLGMVLNRLGRHADAVEQFKKAIGLGEGAYDLFAYLADSLAKLGRTEEAIEWSYKALSVVPGLVDVRGDLAKLLVAAKRPYEALAVLQAHDNHLEARGQAAYFSGQRIAIQTAIELDTSATGSERKALRLPSYAGHFFAPVALGDAKPVPFMVDTGATRTTLSEQLLQQSKARYRVTQSNVQMITADGRRVAAQAITIESASVGWFKLTNVPALVCRDCSPLLGQSTLSGFDMQSSKVQGVESLVLVQR